jgi:uncharacterized membrane protein
MANMIAQAYDHMTHGSAELSMTERGISLVAGLALAAAGAKPRPNVLLNVLALGAGSYLAYRGATGYCPVKATLVEDDTAHRERLGRSREQLARSH